MKKTCNCGFSKIIILIIILLVLLISVLSHSLIKKTPVEKKPAPVFIEEAQPEASSTPFPLSGVYTINFPKTTIKVGEKFEAVVGFTVDNRRIFGSDVVLLFDQLFLEANKNLTLGSYFTNYQRKEVDNEKGIIRVTAFGGSGTETPNKVDLINVSFKAKKTGDTNIRFDFEKRKTSMTTLVEEGTSRNILSEANGVKVTIEP